MNCTSLTDARIVSVRSDNTLTLTPPGIELRRAGSSALMWSATLMMFAPGWRCTFRITARLPSAQPASCAFSTPSMTLATSSKRTGAPFCALITIGL